MYNFDTLHLVNYLLWDDIEFTFSKGITYVTGENGSGKSSLFAPLGPILHNTDYIPKNSRATLSLHTSKHNYDFTVLNQGKARNRFEVNIDNKQQKAERIDDGRNIIDKHYGSNIQESLFKTTIFLNGRKDHPLAEGKPSDRLDWVHETLAYASILDAYLERVDRKMKDAKDDSIRYGMLADQIKKLDVVDKPTADVEALREKASKITDKIRDLEKQKTSIEYALRYKEATENVAIISIKDAQTEYDKYDVLLRKLLKQKEIYETQKDRVSKHKEIQSNLNRLKNTYKNLCKRLETPAINPKNMQKVVDDSLEKAIKLLDNAKNDNEIYDEQEELRAFLKKHKDRTVTIGKDQAKKKIDQLEKKHHVVQLMIDAHTSGKDHCSVCGSDLQGGHHDIDDLRAKNKKRSLHIKQLKTDLKILKARNETVISQKKDINGLKEKVSIIKEMKETCMEYVAAVQQSKNFADVHDIGDFDYKKLKKVQKKYKISQTTLVDAQAQRSVRKTFSGIDDNPYLSKTRKELKDFLESFDNSISVLYKKQRRLNDEIVEAETSFALYKKYRKDKKSLIEDAKTLRSSARDYKLLAVAKKALGRDGFRTKRLASTLELFVDNLNELAPLVWKKPFKFEIETGPRKCDVLVHRNGKVGTAFTLSGAEQRCWQLVSALAMLRLLPDNRRCNTIILDEIDANTDMYTRQRMMSDLLPEVNKTVPNVIVVSPRSTKELFLEADRTFKVVNKGSRSKLLEL